MGTMHILRSNKTSCLRSYSNSLPALTLALFSVLGLGEFYGLAVIRLPILALFFLILLGTIITLIFETQNLRREFKSYKIQTLAQVFFLLAIALKGFTPALIRLSPLRSNYVWDLDNLFFASNARSIFVHGDANKNLGILNEPLNYHTGPAFLLATLQKELNADPLNSIYWLEGIFLLILMLVGLRLIDILTKDKLRNRLAFLIALSLPFARFKEDIRIFIPYIVNRPSVTFDTMFSSIIGILLLLCYWYLMIRGRTYLLIFSTISVSLALLEVKPQFFPLIFLLLFISIPRLNSKVLLVRLSLIIISYSIFNFNSTSKNQIPIKYSFTFATIDLPFIKMLLTSAPIILGLLLLTIFLFRDRVTPLSSQHFWKSNSFRILVSALFLYTASLLFIEIVQIQIMVERWLTPEFATSSAKNDEQLLLPILLFNLFVILNTFMTVFKWRQIAVFGISGLSLFMSFAFFFFSVFTPQLTDDFADLNDAKRAVSSLPRNGNILTNDFYFPSEGYTREYFGYLSALTNAQFYFSMPGNFQMMSSWSTKFQNSFLFFGSQLSYAHLEFLDRYDISSIVYSTRCSSRLINALPVEFQLLTENQLFKVFQVPTQIELNRLKLVSIIESKYFESKPLFGAARCGVPEGWEMPEVSSNLIDR